MVRYRLTHAAQSDVVSILAWSEEQFGAEARNRTERSLPRPSATRHREPMMSGVFLDLNSGKACLPGTCRRAARALPAGWSAARDTS